jgi:tetratricopeptide (TPR) repeat protein
VNDQANSNEGKGRLTLGLAVVFAFLFAFTWSLPSGFGWIFFAASGYCFFLYWYNLPKEPTVRLEVEDAEGRRFEYQTAEQRTQALMKKVVRIVWIGGLSIFSFLLAIGFFSTRDRSNDARSDSDDSSSSELEETVSWNSKGNDFYSSQQYDSALYYYERVLRLEPNNASAWYNKGLVYYDQQQVDKAFESFSKAYDFGMRDAFLSHVLGYLNDNNGNTTRAITFYKEAVGLDSSRFDIYTRLAELEPGNAKKYKDLEARFRN